MCVCVCVCVIEYIYIYVCVCLWSVLIPPPPSLSLSLSLQGMSHQDGLIPAPEAEENGPDEVEIPPSHRWLEGTQWKVDRAHFEEARQSTGPFEKEFRSCVHSICKPRPHFNPTFFFLPMGSDFFLLNGAGGAYRVQRSSWSVARPWQNWTNLRGWEKTADKG